MREGVTGSRRRAGNMMAGTERTEEIAVGGRAAE